MQVGKLLTHIAKLLAFWISNLQLSEFSLIFIFINCTEKNLGLNSVFYIYLVYDPEKVTEKL